MYKILIPAVYVILTINNNAFAQEKIEMAIQFLKEACVIEGRHLQITADGSGNLNIIKLWEAGGQGSVAVSKTEQSGFVSGLTGSAEQVSEQRVCMQPYIKQILDVIIGNPIKNPDAKWKFIQKIEHPLTTGNHNCTEDCRGEPTRTGYTINLTAPESADGSPRLLRNPVLACRTGPCGGWNAVTVTPHVLPNGLSVSASFDVWSKPTTWAILADYYEWR